MIDRIYYIGDIVAVGGLVSLTIVLVTLLVNGKTRMKKLKDLTKECEEYRKKLDDKFFSKWVDFLGKYEEIMSRMYEIQRWFRTNEKKYYRTFQRCPEFDDEIQKLQKFMEIGKTKHFKKHFMRKNLKTKEIISIINTNPERKNQAEKITYGYFQFDLLGELKKICLYACVGIVAVLIIDGIIRNGVGQVLFWNYWKIVLIIFIISVASFIFLEVDLLDGIIWASIVIFIGPIVISCLRWIGINRYIWVNDIWKLLDIFWMLIIAVYLETKYISYVGKCNNHLKKIYLEKEDILNDLKGDEKEEIYEHAFDEEGDVALYVDNMELNLDNIQEKIEEIERLRKRKKKAGVFVEIYSDFKILEAIVLKRSIEDDYYYNFAKIREVNDQFSRM